MTTVSEKESRNGKTMLLIGIVIILLLLILIVVRRQKNRELEASREAASIEASIEESEAQAQSMAASIAQSQAEEANRLTLEECGDEAIDQLIRDYFSLRLAADCEGLYELYGRDASAVDDTLAAKITAQKSWIRSFDDIEVYLLPGEDENEKFGIVKYKINFRRVNTKAPCIMYFCARKSEDGSWKLEDNLLKDTRELLNQEMEEAGVQELVDENTRQLRQALEEDSDLALMYVSFQNGEIYSEANLDPDREQQVDLFVDPQDSILVE